MELAIMTGQRREDIAAMGRKDLRDGRLWIEQGKTQAKVCIPLELSLDVLGWTLAEVIERCQTKHVISKTFVHHVSHIGKAIPGGAVREQSIAAAFAEARDAVGITVPAGKTPPTFHEIRSLAARLYSEQGVNAQALLGHKSADMTAIYRDVRGSEWIEVRTA
jgi:integrase